MLTRLESGPEVVRTTVDLPVSLLMFRRLSALSSVTRVTIDAALRISLALC